MILVEKKKQKTIEDCPIGLFIIDGEVCVKTEYSKDYCPECYIVSSGEFFIGGENDGYKRKDILVTPIKIVEFANQNNSK